jgi:hypothetical protein
MNVFPTTLPFKPNQMKRKRCVMNNRSHPTATATLKMRTVQKKKSTVCWCNNSHTTEVDAKNPEQHERAKLELYCYAKHINTISTFRTHADFIRISDKNTTHLFVPTVWILEMTESSLRKTNNKQRIVWTKSFMFDTNANQLSEAFFNISYWSTFFSYLPYI